MLRKIDRYERLSYFEAAQFLKHTGHLWEGAICVGPPEGVHEDLWPGRTLTEDQRHAMAIQYCGDVTIDCRKPLREEFLKAFREISFLFEFAADMLEESVSEEDVSEWLDGWRDEDCGEGVSL